jgi:hypothetical protein
MEKQKIDLSGQSEFSSWSPQAGCCPQVRRGNSARSSCDALSVTRQVTLHVTPRLTTMAMEVNQ